MFGFSCPSAESPGLFPKKGLARFPWFSKETCLIESSKVWTVVLHVIALTLCLSLLLGLVAIPALGLGMPRAEKGSAPPHSDLAALKKPFARAPALVATFPS